MLTLAACFLSFLPQRWRRGWRAVYDVELTRGALLSGLAEFGGCLALFIVRYIFYIDARMKAVAAALIAQGREDVMASRAFQYGAGAFTLIEYLFHPITIALIYFLVEGLVRFSAALITGEVVGTMPLHLVALAHDRYAKAAAERALGPRIPDEVRSGKAGELSILSCRAKPEWDPLMTISYEGGLYEVAEHLEGPPPRQYIYRLRLKPEHKIVRGLHCFDPNEVLQKREAE